VALRLHSEFTEAPTAPLAPSGWTATYFSPRFVEVSKCFETVIVLEAFGANLEEEINQLHHELKTGMYEPKPVLRVEIPKPDGSKRPLGIPTVRDRVVQQALLNILQPIFDPGFHPSSYGYRPGRSSHKAVAKAERFINRYGLEYVVDMDLSNFRTINLQTNSGIFGHGV